MSGFSADWLALREPYDARARNRDVLSAVAAAFSALPSMNIVDLACGTGSTPRALAQLLPRRQNWKLVDNDLGLLARAANISYPHATITTATVDLSRDLEVVLDGAVDLVTASALFDLVSAQWLDRLISEAAIRNLPIYGALNYDGRISFTPAHTYDATMIAAVNDHQRIDKGFGPALGPIAPDRAMSRLKAAGYSVVHGPADWLLAPQDRAIQIALLDGWAGAVRELQALPLAEIMAWLTHRRDCVAIAQTSVRVGHVDFFAMPIGRR